MAAILGYTCDFFQGGFLTFVPKYLELYFGFSAGVASIVSGRTYIFYLLFILYVRKKNINMYDC